MEYNENRKKKRKFHFEQISNNNELPEIISSFSLHIDLKSKVTIHFVILSDKKKQHPILIIILSSFSQIIE